MNATDMLKVTSSRFIIATALFLLGFGVHGASPGDQHTLASADIGFAFKLLKQVAKTQPGGNVCISPYSASSVLQMASTGAGGQTKLEMAQVLGTAGMPTDTLLAGIRDVSRSLNSGSASVVLTAANALWYRQGIPMIPEFVSRSQEFFGATVDALDFNDPRSVAIVNAWAKEKTRGRIPAIADGLIDPATDLFLANAVYFKGKWEVPFEMKLTKDRVFHLRSGRERKLPMMEQTRRFTYRRGTGYQAVRLPYQGWSVAMYVFLPDDGSSPEKLLSVLSGDTWQRVTEPGFNERQGTVVLPRFKLEYGVDLKEPLKGLGMKAAFGKADFSGVSTRPLFISAVRQRTFIEVNEEGTEAVATTDMMISSGIDRNPPKPFQMIVDRPFLFLIENKQTRTILFMGIVFNPGGSS